MTLPQILSYLLARSCCMVWYTIPTMQSVSNLIWTNKLNGPNCGKCMAFNLSTCYILRVCRTRYPFIHPYNMLGHTLQAVDHCLYLGVSLSEDLNWKPHVLNTTNKANSTLRFVKRNLHHCS